MRSKSGKISWQQQQQQYKRMKIPVGGASVRGMHKEMLNIGTRRSKWWKSSGKATQPRWPPKTNVGRKRKVQQLARTHRQTRRRGEAGSMWQGQLAKRCNWEIGRLVDCTWATRRRYSMRHAKPPHTRVEKFGEKTNGKLNQVFRFSLCVFLSHFPPKTTQ